MAARQIYSIKKGVNETITVDMIGILSKNQKLSGTPVVTVVPSVDGPTISNEALNVDILPNVNGRNVPAGEAATFFVTTTDAEPKMYTLKIEVGKTGTPEPKRIEEIYLRITP